ncbi:hypothetical protein SEVIR_9G387700v4 [Setaria viridis]|uniref:Uncharacterized protein n=1 Tax=Setaria viridis TaxID=4556 RepID=A0A4U6T545_SETVI|nr:FBD-associated F-box protein At5g60610-like [Setaria viridis]TKV95833.1 hypothetical protein SEVIR_9G387700v2 [Setaria viridis]
MEAAAPGAKKRRAEAPETGTSSTPATAATDTPTPEATPIKKTGAHSSQEPPPPGAGGEDGSVDRISGLPDAILGDIISLLPTKEAARTQVLASRWAHLWRAAPLNLDCRDLPEADDEVLAGVVSRILSAHRGPGRLFRVPAHHVHDRAATVDAWLRSPALDNLQEIEFCDHRRPALEQPPTPPASLFRFSATLRAATICRCHIPDGGPVQGIRFPQLQQLGLVRVRISEGSLHSMISRSSFPALEYLFLDSSHGFRCVRINSTSLRSIGVRTDYYGQDLRFQELVIEDAPCLEKLLCAQRVGFHVSVMAAPKLETLGSLSNWPSKLSRSRHVFGSTVFQGLDLVSFTSAVRGVKILSVDLLIGNLDMVIGLMKCFPCLEKLYVKGSISGRREKNLWRRKHRHLIQCFDSHIKTLVLENYEGIKSHVSFASFFLLNARELELMRLEVAQKNCNEEFFAEQRVKLQVEGRACRGARLDFALNRCHCRIIHIDHVHDLTIADPFECTC